ncbi:hypothetical protein IAT38_006727 [Cryptococcus sp. DSM 104549]
MPPKRSTAVPDEQFCKALPKVELHAHLTGSISRESLQEIWEMRKAEEPELALEAPSIVLADEKVGQSVHTFFSLFNGYLYSLITTLPALRHATLSVLQAFAADGVVYLELRTTPRALPPPPNSTTPIPSSSAISTILSVIEEWNASPSGKGMTASLLLSLDRAKHSPSQAMEIAQLALQLRDAGRPVVGLDLAGDPNAPCDYASFRPAFALAREKDLPFTLHFAECPRSSSPEELEELLSWAPSRLGHAIYVPEDMRKRIAEREIGVELCLSCNVLADMLPRKNPEVKCEFSDHHFGQWWKHSRAVVGLGTDDVGVFGSPSSQEHFLAAKHFGLDGIELIRISWRALEGAFGYRKVAWRKIEDFAQRYD